MEQLTLAKSIYANKKELFTIPEASAWATEYVRREITVSNISYLIQYGRIRKLNSNRGVCVSRLDLENYYNSYDTTRESTYKTQLGNDINWELSFSRVKEAESTKHVHRLHPYKGKFIPQLVEYFIDSHTDDFKREVYFKQGDIILDPFSGSGTTMVQANECGMDSIGIDVSSFNALIANCKVARYDLADLHAESNRISYALREFTARSNIAEFENTLLAELNKFNNEFFPVPGYKYRLNQGEVNEDVYGAEKERLFFITYNKLIQEYGIRLYQEKNSNFLEKWFLQQVRNEIEFTFEQIEKVQNQQTRSILNLILSRTMRSCRATTHSDLATLIEPVTSTYYCSKHGKICKPLFSIVKWWESYCKDTIRRLGAFNILRTPTEQYCLTGDSRSINIIEELKMVSPWFAKKVSGQRIAGIFSSPPYVGMIDYHEQHAYAYDLFRFERRDDCEIGPLFRGKGKEARQSYIDGISSVLNNCKKYLAADYNIFLVANDKHNLYPIISEKAGMSIVNMFRRPVLNRSEKDKTAYSETIFHMRERN
ncbi:MAG: site-specific DNA-methyltransferase [Oscillospiraceae bacterium]|nr:site-specific DNA-methyltransferase [Oscillospiraceae bacterium]